MRILDIGIATGYALLCLALISTMNPYQSGTVAVRDQLGGRTSQAILEYITSVGLVFLGDAPPAQLCASLLQHSNSSLVLGGSIDGYSCSPAPTAYQGHSSLSLALNGRQLTIDGWILEK